MKKTVFCIFIVLALFVLTSCRPATLITTVGTTGTAAPTSAGTEATSTGATTAATTAVTTTEVTTSTVPSTTEAETTATTKAEPVNQAELYSSYALMKSYDPTNSWAKFDYFDMLRGEAAVQWLVDKEGYSLADAQAEVANYGDSEFIMKNENPQLRTIDLSNYPLKLMYHADGSVVDGPDPVDSSVADLNAIFAANPDLILDSYFYYIEVVDGIVQSVVQVYWP